MALCGSRTYFKTFFSSMAGCLTKAHNSINYIGLVFIVPTGAHSVSLTMKITTTYSLNALILKRYGGMLVIDATFIK
jgi:hypothetical protein